MSGAVRVKSGQGEVSVAVSHGGVSARELDGDATDAGAGNQVSLAVHTPFGLHIAALGGLGERKGGGQEEENEGENFFHNHHCLFLKKHITARAGWEEGIFI